MPTSTPAAEDAGGVASGHARRGAARRTRRWAVAGIVLVKVVIVGLVLALPCWLAVLFGAVHGVAVGVVLVTAAVVVLTRRPGRTRLSALSPHGWVAAARYQRRTTRRPIDGGHR